MKKKETSSTEKAQKKSSSSKPVQKSTSKQKKKNPISKYSKPKTELVDYFPRGSGPKDDFTSNIGIINPSQKSSKKSLKNLYFVTFVSPYHNRVVSLSSLYCGCKKKSRTETERKKR